MAEPDVCATKPARGYATSRSTAARARHALKMLRLRVLRHGCMMGAMPHDNDLIGTAEAARILGRSPRTVHRMVDAGDLTPAFKAPGGHHGTYLFNRADVEALAKAAA